MSTTKSVQHILKSSYVYKYQNSEQKPNEICTNMNILNKVATLCFVNNIFISVFLFGFPI